MAASHLFRSLGSFSLSPNIAVFIPITKWKWSNGRHAMNDRRCRRVTSINQRHSTGCHHLNCRLLEDARFQNCRHQCRKSGDTAKVSRFRRYCVAEIFDALSHQPDQATSPEFCSQRVADRECQTPDARHGELKHWWGVTSKHPVFYCWRDADQYTGSNLVGIVLAVFVFIIICVGNKEATLL